MNLFLSIFVPFAFRVLKKYQENPSSKFDAVLLESVKDSVSYLAHKDNNTVDYELGLVIDSTGMKG